MSVDWYNLYAHRRCGVVDGWAWFKLRAVDKHIIATGAVCDATYQRGPRKGRKNWDKRARATEREIVIPLADLDALKIEWENETGGCSPCSGSGQRLVRWSKDSGREYSHCLTCRGTGKRTNEI